MLLCLNKYTMPLQVKLKLMCIQCIPLYFSFSFVEFSLICLLLGSLIIQFQMTSLCKYTKIYLDG